MKVYAQVVVFSLAIAVGQLSFAYDQKWLPKQPITYTGSCDVDKPQLDRHSGYWNSGKHGSDPEACAYIVDQLIIHREIEKYLSRPTRCKYNGQTYTSISGSIYFGERESYPDDGALLVGMRDATARLERAIKCGLSPEQAAEVKRQNVEK
jgi:hypothetical protein